ncbi:MAG: ribosome maturation factor RimP [Wolinella sp.]
MITPEMTQKIEKIAASCDCILYDVVLLKENERAIVRVFITKSGGVGLEECERVSELLSPLLDVEDPVAGEYFLEVSSPGVERALKKPEHFCHSIGELVRIKLADQREIEGTITAANETGVTLNESEEIPYTLIKKAQTFYRW